MALSCPNCSGKTYRPPVLKPGTIIKDVLIVTVQNGGQTPAYNVHAYLNWGTMGYGFSLPSEFTYPDYPSKLSLLIGVVSLNPGKDITFNFPFDIQTVLNARAHKNNLFVYGHIDYRDVFHKRRQSQFCYLYAPDASDGFSTCTEHNNSN